MLKDTVSIDVLGLGEEMGCPSLNRFKGNRFPYCETHFKGGVCALNNANIILTFLLK